MGKKEENLQMLEESGIKDLGAINERRLKKYYTVSQGVMSVLEL